MRLLAALSGGVDSAVAAARAADDGHEVTTVHLALAEDGPPGADGRGGGPPGPRHGCCTPADARDAARVADVLGLPHYVWDSSRRFAEQVVDAVVADYAAGRTPNPCATCNERVKVAHLLARGRALGYDGLVTGHHARLDGEPRRLRRSVDPAKDQSYVLAGLGPDVLAGLVLPLGTSTKAEVRAEARERGLLVADKPDSVDLCFVPSGDLGAFLARRLGARPGPVVDGDGRHVGRHDGAWAFTVGQRRGLRLDVPAADGRPRYVTRVDPTAGTVHVGGAGDLDVDALRTGPPTWCGRPPALPGPALLQGSAHGRPVAVHVAAEGSGPEPGLVLTGVDGPLRALAPGQVAALYDAGEPDAVLGSARVAGRAVDDPPVGAATGVAPSGRSAA